MEKFNNLEESPIKIKNLTDNISKNAKTLNIEIISSIFEPKGLILKINPYGYEKSLRHSKDGITYFGYEENIDKEQEVSLLIL